MNKKLLSVVFFIAVILSAKAQQQLFLGLQSGWGYGLTSFEQNKHVLKSKTIPWQINTGLLVQYRIANSFALECGASIDNLIWKVGDRDFKARYGGRFEANMTNKIGYPSFFINAQYAFEVYKTDFSSGNYIYIQVGGGHHNYGKKLLTQQKDFVHSGTVVETVRMETQYNGGSYFFAPEIGFLKLNPLNQFSVGLMAAFNINGNMFNSNYTTTKPDGTIISSDKLTATGSYIGLNLKVGVSLFYIEKREKAVKEKVIKEKKVKTPKVKKVKPPKVKKEKGLARYHAQIQSFLL